MWERFQRFEEHLPTVILAWGIAGLAAAAIEAKSVERRREQLGCLRLCLRAGCSAALGSVAAGIFAAGVVELLPQHPWMVLSGAWTFGLSVDISTRAGLMRLRDLMLRTNLRIARALSESDEQSK